MEISAINSVMYPAHVLYKIPNKTNELKQENRNFEFPSHNFYNLVSFTGGKSMDLAQTKERLDKYAQYPLGIREDIEETLKTGNPENKLLLDVHKEHYIDLKDCNDLADVKYLYPEFEGVLSDSETKYNKGSFIDKVKKGEIKGFDPKKDVSLQLIQLYWGEGFSLPTLEQEYGQNIYGVFDKLRIPKVNQVYGQYLKLSDRDYNSKFSEYMSQRAKEIERKKPQKSVEVKPQDMLQTETQRSDEHKSRAPLSEDHKLAIKEGVKQYYIDHPEKIAELRQRYIDNPQERERFTQVLLRAWSYREAEPIKRRMSKFMQKDYMKDTQLLVEDMQSNRNLGRFWEKNPWARDKFSLCMKKSWQRQKELTQMGLIYEPLYVASIMPAKMKREIGKLYDYGDLEKNLCFVVPSHDEQVKYDVNLLKLNLPNTIEAQSKVGDLMTKWAISMLFSVDKAIRNLDSKDMRDTFGVVLDTFSQKIKSGVNMASNLCEFYKQIVGLSLVHNLDFIKNVDSYMASFYDKIENKNEEEMLQIFETERQKVLYKFGKKHSIIKNFR